MVAQELSTPASTTTRTRNMAVQQSGRTSAAAHTAWRRPLICAVSVAATLCCFFVPGAVSPMPPRFPDAIGQSLLKSWKHDTLENHPPTLLDNAPVLEEAFELFRGYYPEIDELLEQDFPADSAPINSSKLELTSKDVERYVGARPDIDKYVPTCMSELKLKDFNKMANDLICYSSTSPPANGRFTPALFERTAQTVFTSDEDLTRVFKTNYNRGFAPISFEKHDDYWEKPSYIPDDVETWVQASIRESTEGPWYEIKLTVHPNDKPNEPEGIAISFHGFLDENSILVKNSFQLKARQQGNKGVVSANITRSYPGQNILEYKVEDDLFLTRQYYRTPEIARGTERTKGALDLALFCGQPSPFKTNKSTNVSHWSKHKHYINKFGDSFQPTSAATEDDMRHSFSSEVKVPGTEEEYQRDFSLKVHQDEGFGEKQVQSFGIERILTLMNSDNLERAFYKQPIKYPTSKGARDSGKNKAKLHIYQRSSHFLQEKDIFGNKEDKKSINIGFFLDDETFSSPLFFNLERIVQPVSPGGEDKTIEVRRHLLYISESSEPLMHVYHLTQDGYVTRTFPCDLENLFMLDVNKFRSVPFLKNNLGFVTPSATPKGLQNACGTKRRSRQQPVRDEDSMVFLPSSDKPQSLKNSTLIFKSLVDGGLFFLGTIAALLVFTALLKSPPKSKKVRGFQNRIGVLSNDNVSKEQ